MREAGSFRQIWQDTSIAFQLRLIYSYGLSYSSIFSSKLNLLSVYNKKSKKSRRFHEKKMFISLFERDVPPGAE